MPKELLEIKNFTLGTQTTPSETDISHEAASYSLNVDPIAQDGKLQAIPDDETKDADWADATGNQAEMMRVIEVDGVKSIITYTSDGKIRYSYNLTTASTATALADLKTGLTANLQNGDNLDMEVNNQEVHIGLGNANNPQWVGNIPHNQFGASYSGTNNGIYATDAELKSPSQFKACYKLIFTHEDTTGDGSADTRFVYGIEYKGNRVYKFKEDTAGAAYSFVSASATRFESTQGICRRYASGGNETALGQKAIIWIYDAGTGKSGTLYAYDPTNDTTVKTFPINHSWTDDTDHTYISDILEVQTTNITGDNSRLLYFSKHYEKEFPIIHKDYYSGNSGELNVNYGESTDANGGAGIGILYSTDQASYQTTTNANVASKTITLYKNTPTLFPEDGSSDNQGTPMMPYYKGTGTGFKGWTYMEPYHGLTAANYTGKYLGGLVGGMGRLNNSPLTDAAFGDADDSRILNYATISLGSGTHDWAIIKDAWGGTTQVSNSTTDGDNTYKNCSPFNAIMHLWVGSDKDASDTGIPYNHKDYLELTSDAKLETCLLGHIMQKNWCIDSTNQLIFQTQRAGAGVKSLYSSFSFANYAALDTKGDDSNPYGIGIIAANRRADGEATLCTKLSERSTSDAQQKVYGNDYNEVVCDPALKCVIVGKGCEGVVLYSYYSTDAYNNHDGINYSGPWELGTARTLSCADLFGTSNIRVDKVLIDTYNQVGIAIGHTHVQDAPSISWWDGDVKIAWFNYQEDAVSFIGKITVSQAYVVSASVDGEYGKLATQLISSSAGSSLADGYYLSLHTYALTGNKGTYTAVSSNNHYQYYQSPTYDSESKIPIDILVDGKNNLIHTTERHATGRATISGTSATAQPARLELTGSAANCEIYQEGLYAQANSHTPHKDPFSGNGSGDTDTGGGGDYISSFGNTQLNSFLIEGNEIGAHIQSFNWNDTDRADYGHGQMTLTSDGKYMFLGGTADCRSILFLKRNVNNKNTDPAVVSKSIFTHAQVHFKGAGTWDTSGSFLGRVLIDENMGLAFSQKPGEGTNPSSIYSMMYCIDDHYRISTPKANLVATIGGNNTTLKSVGLIVKSNHPLGFPFHWASGDGSVSKWLMYCIHGKASDIGLGVAANTTKIIGEQEISVTGTVYAAVDSNPDTITSSSNNFVTAGFKAGMTIQVSGSSEAANNTTHVIASVAAGTLTLTSASSLTADGAGDSWTIKYLGAATVKALEWTNDKHDRLYDANVLGITNIVDPDGIVDSDDESRKRHIALFYKKDDNNTYITTYQKHDALGPVIPEGAYSDSEFSFSGSDGSVNTGDVNIPEAVGALRWDATGVLNANSDLFGFIASSKSGLALSAALKVDGNSDAANPSDSGATYDPSADDVVEGPSSNAYLNNANVISTGGTLKKNYKYFYKLTFVYDGYQESPLGDDLQVETTYASSDYTDGILNSTAEAIDANTVSINIDANIDSSSIDKRITSVKLYRAENPDTTKQIPEGFYRLVEEKSLEDGWGSTSISGSKPTLSTSVKKYTFNDVGNSFQNFEANTGISEVIDSYNIKYKCSTQLNNTHFVGNCTTGLDSSLLGSNYIAKSKPYNFDQFNVLTDVLQVSGTVVAMASFAGRIFAFSETKVFKIEPNNLFIEDTWEGMGTFNQKSVFVSDYGMCWCDKNNIYLWDGRQVKTIGDAILKGDSTNSWQEGSLVYTPATDSAASMEPQVFWDPERKAFLIMFTSDTDYRKIWAYSVAKNRWDLWDMGDGAQVQSFVHGPSGEVFYVKYGSRNLFWLNGHATTRKPLSWHSKKLTMGMDTQVKLFKKVRITGFDGVDENVLNSDVNVSFLTAAGNPENSNEFSDGTTQSVYSLSTSAAKSEWLKVKIDAAENDNLQIDSIGIIYRRRPIR